eukprot:179771_1
MEDIFGFDDSRFSDRVLLIIEPDDRPAKRTRQEGRHNSGGRQLHVCQWILCSQSEYFNNLFGTNFAESKNKHVEICVQKGETDTFVKLLHSFYFRALPDKNEKYSFETSSLEELVKIIRLADMYGAPVVLQDVFREVSKRELTLEICETLLDLPDHIISSGSFKTLQNESISKSLLKVFSECMELAMFSAKSVKILMGHDDLPITREDVLWCLFIEWLNAMDDNGQDISDETVDSLLKLIRFEYVNQNYLTQIVATWPHWLKTPQRGELFVAALRQTDIGDVRTMRRLMSVVGFHGMRKERLADIPTIRRVDRLSFINVRGIPLVLRVEGNTELKSVFLVVSIDFSHPCMKYLNPKSSIKVYVVIVDITVNGKAVDRQTGVFTYDGPCEESDTDIICKLKLGGLSLLSSEKDNCTIAIPIAYVLDNMVW